MRSARTFFAFAVMASISLSCAGVKRYARRDPARYSLHLWVDDHPSLSKPDALKGCQEWAPKGVTCALVESKHRADIRVTADMKACVPDEKGKRTLALAYKGGDVVFMMQCFKKGDGYDQHQFRAVMTHEVGHEIGVWEHVPEDCDDKEHKAIVLEDGKKVCGQAVMNPYYEEKIWFVTEIDSLAFDVRDLEYSVVTPLGSDEPPPPRPKPSGPDCTYHD